MKHAIFYFFIAIFLLIRCSPAKTKESSEIVKNIEQLNPSTEFNAYWFNNEAELTSYQLEQARYGEIHKGNAVLVYVTEPFSVEKQVKADAPTPNDYTILKLNFVKKFNTGIYPYSMMSSFFLPINNLNNNLVKELLQNNLYILTCSFTLSLR